MAGIKKSILDTVGNTPVVCINNIAPAGVELFVKLEANGVAFDRAKKADAYTFLPKWLHPR